MKVYCFKLKVYRFRLKVRNKLKVRNNINNVSSTDIMTL